jgi:NADH-quinone oxidoreductase subunit N
VKETRLVVTLATSSAIGLYYYLRVIVVTRAAAHVACTIQTAAAALPLPATLVLAVLVLLVWLGAYPSPIIQLIESVVAGLA